MKRINQLRSISIVYYINYVLGLVLLIVPVMIYVIQINSSTPIAGWLTMGHLPKLYTNYDVFFLVKAYALFILTGILIVLFIYYIRCNEDNICELVNYQLGYKLDYKLIVIILFGVWLIISGLYSDEAAVAFWGFRHRYEGVFAYIAYIIMLIIARYSHVTGTSLDRLFLFMLTGAGIVASVAVLQISGINAVDSIMRALLGYQDSSVSSAFGLFNVREGLSIAYGTLYNPNYLSAYLGTLIIVPTVFYFHNSGRWAYYYLALAMLLWAGLLASRSSSGLVAFGCVLLLFFLLSVLKLNSIKISWKKLLVFIIVLVTVFFAMDYQIPGLINEFTSVFRYATDIFNTVVQSTDTFTVTEDTLDEQFLYEYQMFQQDADWQLLYAKYPHESSIDRLGSGRGFIWRCSFPLIMDRPIVGYGMDTFIYYFPHGEMRKFYAFGNNMGMVVDKPHSLYIQLAYGAGIPALVLFLVFNGLLIFKSWNKLYNENVLAILLLVVAYLIQSVFNDSTIGVSVVYWVMAGVLLGLVNCENDDCIDGADY